MSLRKVEEWYMGLPPVERDMPLVPDEITDRAYSPRRVLEEVRKDTELGKRLQRKVETGILTEEITLREIAKYRLKKTLEDLPTGWGIVTYGKQYTKEELIELVQKEENIGEKWIEEEIKRMKELMR